MSENMNRLSRMERFYKNKGDLGIRRAESMKGTGRSQEEVSFAYVFARLDYLLSQMYAEIRNAIRYQRNVE